MELTPRYDGRAPIRLDEPSSAQLAPTVRQRRRFADVLAGLDDEQWLAPSRCDGWTVRDVAAHLVTVNSFWESSITAGVAGDPTRMLVGFDPAASPPQFVAAMADLSAAQVMESFVSTNDSLIARLESLDDRQWESMAEAPPGHMPVRLVAQHALWDSWVHERDVAVPLGLPLSVEADEVASCLRYAAAFGPVLATSADVDSGPRGDGQRAGLGVAATEPDVAFVVEVGDDGVVSLTAAAAPSAAPVLEGRAVDLVERLSLRAPLPDGTPDAWRDLVRRLAVAFT